MDRKYEIVRLWEAANLEAAKVVSESEKQKIYERNDAYTALQNCADTINKAIKERAPEKAIIQPNHVLNEIFKWVEKVTLKAIGEEYDRIKTEISRDAAETEALLALCGSSAEMFAVLVERGVIGDNKQLIIRQMPQ